VPAAANAIGNRDAQFYFTVGGPTFGRDIQAALTERFMQLRAELAPYVSGGGYLNFMSGSQALNRAQAAYLPESFRRLQALKAQYDPDNLFRHSYQLVAAETA
jgi:FAD/FMN-containing dehydrogenase